MLVPGVKPTSVRMSDLLFMQRNEQGVYEQLDGSPDARHWGEL